MGLLRTLLTPRWLGALVLAAVFAVVCVNLGQWQFGRHADKAERRDLVQAHYSAAPVPFSSVLPDPAGPLPAGAEWTRVSLTGRYDAEQLLVRNRPHEGRYGYEVAAILQPGSGPAVLVDRGWVPNAADASTLPEVPPAPEVEVEVVGWLRPAQQATGRDLPDGQLGSVSTAEAGRATGRDLARPYLILDTERPVDGSPAPARPTPLEAPDTGVGVHFAYALQWWMTAPVGFVMVLVLARREQREAAPRRPGSTSAREPVLTGSGASAAPHPARPKRTWIWDEEDE